MFKATDHEAVRAIVGEGNRPLTPSAFADFLELLKGFRTSEFTRMHDDNGFIGVWGAGADRPIHLNLRYILPVQMKPHEARVWAALRRDNADSVGQMRNALFGGSWRMVRVVEASVDEAPGKVFEAVMAPSGHPCDEARHVVARGCCSESIAMLAVCARAIGPAGEMAQLPEAVEKFSQAVSGEGSVSSSVLDLLPGMSFGHVKHDILEVLSKGSMRDAEWVKVSLIGPHYQAKLHQSGEDNRQWCCRMVHPDEMVTSVPVSAPCRNAAMAMVLASLQAYVREFQGGRRRSVPVT